MGGGILPVAIRKGVPYFLFSRETVDGTGRDRGLWSDFGGAKEPGESDYQAALREGHEESSGIIGSPETIKKLVRDRLIKKIKTKYYTSYLVRIRYNRHLPSRFSRRYRAVRRDTPELIAKDGLYEKDKLRWVSINNLTKHRQMFRPWYRYIVDRIILAFDDEKS
jgi:8-oxo-dGTP pyrophosphatase MutT (NUDIX family)